MGLLLSDQPLLILEGIALAAAGIGLLLASVARDRSRQPGSRVAHIFWRDVSQAGFIWSGATIVILAGALLQVEGLRMPIWIFLAIVVGVVCLAVARIRWVRQGMASEHKRMDDPSRPDRPRLVATTWEFGILGAGVGGLLVYAVSASHVWGHPIHWLVAGVGVGIGYAVGLIVATPRYTLKRSSA
jgi:lipid-A-disaccharide synthase-like uncharacterized protein